MYKNIYHQHKIENLINITDIVTIHYFEFDKSFESDGEAHDFWEIVYADKDDLIIQTESEVYTLKEGYMTFHKPMEFHKHSADKSIPPNVFIISFVCNSKAMSFFENKVLFVPKSIRHYISTIISEAKQTFELPFFNPYMNRLKLLPNPNLGGQQLIRTSLEQMLILLIRFASTETSSEIFVPSNQLDSEIYKAIVTVLQEHIYSSLTLTDICKSTNYSKTFLCTSFHKTTGVSIMQFYLNLKINAAKKLIRERKLTFSQISEKLSFSSPAYFTQVFKKHTRMTPSQYISSVRTPNNTTPSYY
mgnify:CR=1 FL=1